MFENYQICPYTGLRSFTEDESLYFKGREEDIEQATDQLQRNKFLMLTGASGDGKSSLVFAGIIPNARAGFLKAKYSQWCIADFRPERSPFLNLCNSVAKQLDIPDTLTVQGELNHGFSALVDLYRNSKRYIDTSSVSWQQADEKARGAMKREAANLIILVDQFEEFFTNPENYQQGIPSKDANLVLNLLLETARISLEEDVPIYVIFTMRSDYIGQCAAFRGLPEYIGFSQFFVPRLNRSQLQLVIEEPANLSGNRITRRLTERLIHDITEGVDQLPILQHALNQIWVAADHGNEEMDLLHYAKVGGMPFQELPEEQVEQFTTWFAALPPVIKACYHVPGLQNVLDTHCNKLFEQACDYYRERTGKEINPPDAKMIIRTTFTCLTKIDQGRAVRNRMTLQEITNILSNAAWDTTAVGTLLDIFREPGNTFIHPFIQDENEESKFLKPGQVLDITHESLIRNWQYLGNWAKEEFDSYSVSLDFEKQLERWVTSDKSNAFLLSIGPLTYFESWYLKAKPNASWIARYLPEETSREGKLVKANEVLENSREFIDRSARKHVITRMVMRFGMKRIVAVLAVIALISLTSFAINSYLKKQNSAVFGVIDTEVARLVNDPSVIIGKKAGLIAGEIELGRLTVDQSVSLVKDTLQRIFVSNGIGSLLVWQGSGRLRSEILRAFMITDSLLDRMNFSANSPDRMGTLLGDVNTFRAALELAFFYDPLPAYSELRKKNAVRSAKWSSVIALTQPAGFTDIQNFLLALENGINYTVFSTEELNACIKKISPFESTSLSEWVNQNFQKETVLYRGDFAQNYGFKFNGLYQDLAYLYAAAGKTDKVLQCMDSLLAYSENNFQGDYASGTDNAANIAFVFYANGQQDKLDAFVMGYCLRKHISGEEFYARVIGRKIPGVLSTSSLHLFWWMVSAQNLNVQYADKNFLDFFYGKYRETVEKEKKDPSEKNFLLALSYKNEAVQRSLYHDSSVNRERDLARFFDTAFSFYNKTDPKYLEVAVHYMGDAGLDEMSAPRKYLFLNPDLRTPFHPLEPRSFFFFYFSDAFIQYIIRNGLFDKFYSGPTELNYVSIWLTDYNFKSFNPNAFLVQKHLQPEMLKSLRKEIIRRIAVSSADFNLLFLNLGFLEQSAGNLDEMVADYDQLQLENIYNLFRAKEFDGQVRNQALRLYATAIAGYIKAGQTEKAMKLAAVFKSPVNRSSVYAYAATVLYSQKSKTEIAAILVDSSKAELKRIENIKTAQPNRRVIAYAMAMQDPSGNSRRSYEVIKNLPAKFGSIASVCRSFAWHGDLYDAYSTVPEKIAPTDKSDFFQLILLGYIEGSNLNKSGWQEFHFGDNPMMTKFIQYIDENN